MTRGTSTVKSDEMILYCKSVPNPETLDYGT